MTYRVLPTTQDRVKAKAFAASVNESRVFSALAEALSWAARFRHGNVAVVVMEEPVERPLSLRSPEEAARSVA